ncbi:Secreted effector protein pipB2 [Pseudodesulfovibrio hydrargyri]|uniref:Secreted effector protein pipB2 n=2 Tax=Pseudodesulfovibrio hydrargyri TaxID=2125990 RepID=A0A1J5MR46_9BACT|nr:Secreted effector protein pipB2 [Pseudodesulfovibrio hydrargyri]
MEANFEKANLVRADLQVAKFIVANLKDANLQGASLQRTNLVGANLGGANLEKANLRGTNLMGVNLREANLKGTNFEKANFKKANLDEANLQGASLEGADLTDCKFSSRAQLNGLTSRLTSQQEAQAIFLDEKDFYSGWKCHVEGTVWPAAPPMLRLHVDGPPLSLEEWGVLLIALGITCNRIRYLLETSDSQKIVDEAIKGPCFPNDLRRAMRVLAVESGSWEYLIGVALDTFSKKERRFIARVALLLAGCWVAACTFNEATDGISKLRQTPQVETEALTPPPAEEKESPESAPPASDEQLPALQEGTLMVDISEEDRAACAEHFVVPDEVRAELGDKTDLLPQAMAEFIALQAKLQSYGLTMKFSAENVEDA